MSISFFSYKTVIKQQPFTSDSGKKFPYTAAITLYDEYNKEIGYLEKAYVKAETIYKSIDKEEEMLLDQCYVENFSIGEYRKTRNLPPDKIVSLKNFSAFQAIFESSELTDFSF